MENFQSWLDLPCPSTENFKTCWIISNQEKIVLFFFSLDSVKNDKYEN